MSNVPIPEPDFVQVHKPAFYKDIPIRLDWWSATSMHAHAAKTSAAKDKEIERLRAEVAGLRAEVAGLRAFVEHVRRNGSTHLANMAVAVLAARKGEA